jgi:hypothetical protein
MYISQPPPQAYLHQRTVTQPNILSSSIDSNFDALLGYDIRHEVYDLLEPPPLGTDATGFALSCKAAYVELLEAVVKAQETLVADRPSRLASQRALAMSYRADGPVKKVVELLEHVVTVEGGFLRDDHPDRLASLTALTYLHAEVGGGSR